MPQNLLPAARKGRHGLRLVEAAGRPNRLTVRPLGSLRVIGPEPEDGRRTSILLAYHARTARRNLAAFLLREGYNVTSCDDGDAAVRHLQSSRVDLVITGLIMRNTDGLELIHRLRDQGAALPIIALADESDQMSQVYLHYAALCGARGTLTVPVDPGIFRDQIGHILRKSEPVIREAV